MKQILLFFIMLLFFLASQGQNNCLTADPFCTGTTYNFPAGTNTSAESGPNYGCLVSQPNPAWYYLKVATSGAIEIYMYGSSGYDIDFICWGPFTSNTAPCTAQLTGSETTSDPYSGACSYYPSLNTIDCSFDPQDEEWCYIPNAVVGQYYILLITNFSNVDQNIVFSQSGGTGATDCSIVAPPITNNGPLCVGQTLQLTVTSPVTGATYAWTGPNGFTSTLMNPTIANVTAANAGVYSLVITVGGTSSPPVTTTVVVNPNPTITLSASPNAICDGSSTTLTAAGGLTYSAPGGVTTNPTVVSPTATTTYTVTGTDANGCSNTASVSVTVNPNPTVSASAAPSAVCPGGSSTLSASGASSYVWSNGASGASTSVTPASTTTYTVTGTSAAGCTGTASVSVTVNPNPVVSATASPASVCSGQSSTLAASGASTYQWSNGSSGSSVTVNPTSTTTYTVTGTSASGCTGTTTIMVTVNSNATITASASPASICSGESSTISASGGSTYIWSPSGSGASFVASPATTTTYSVTGTTASGCSGTTTVTLTVNALPNITATASPAAVCVGFSTTISGGGGTSYVWDNGQNTASFSEIPTATTTYNVTGTDANNCSNTATVTVTLMSGLTVNITPAVENICEGESATLTASSPGSGVVYSWDTGAGTASVNVSPMATTTYSVTGTDTQGCSGTASAVVNVDPMPLAGFTAGPLTGCDPTLVNFTDQSTGNITIWDWEFGDGDISGLQNPSHVYGAGTFSVTLTVTTAAGCQSAASMNNYISILSNPNAAFTATPAVTTEDAPTITFINQSTGANIFAWSFGDDVGTDFTENPIYTYNGNGSYVVTLWVENAAGCADSSSMLVNIKPSYTFYLPNAFSPNGDGRNEVLRPSGTGWDSDTYSMRIYSRWGELVFSTTDINHGWNGLLPDGAEALQGVYSVIIRLRGLDGTERDYNSGVGLLR